MPELDIKMTDSAGDGRPIENDPVIARDVVVRAEADWLLDRLQSLLPLPLTFNRVDPTSCAIGSPEFLNLGPLEARQDVENVLRNVTALMHVYSPNTRRLYEVLRIREQHASGRNSIIQRFSLGVNKTDGHAALCECVGPESRVTLLLRLAETDDQVMHALGLIAAADPGWHAIYDVLEFIEKTIVIDLRNTDGFEEVCRTANHYRHLGAKKNFPLSKNPPTLDQAREFAFGLLKEWLEERLTAR